MTIGHDACCSVLEPLQLQDVSGIATAPGRAAVFEVRLNDASRKSFHNCLREQLLGMLWKANCTRSFLSDWFYLFLPCQMFVCLTT